MPFLSFSHIFLQDAYKIITPKSADNFEIVHKTCSILVKGAFFQDFAEIYLQFAKKNDNKMQISILCNTSTLLISGPIHMY